MDKMTLNFYIKTYFAICGHGKYLFLQFVLKYKNVLQFLPDVGTSTRLRFYTFKRRNETVN